MLEAAREESSLSTRLVLCERTFFWNHFIYCILTNTFPAGRSGCGKSFLLLQLVQHCASEKWIVIYIPRAVSLVNSTTAYTYDIRTQTYLQPVYAFQLIQRILKVNSELLNTVLLEEDLVLEKETFTAGKSLSQLLGFAVRAKARKIVQSPLVLETVMKTLEKQTQ